MATLASWVARERPAAVVVDVSVEVALLARLCGIARRGRRPPGRADGPDAPRRLRPRRRPPRPVAGGGARAGLAGVVDEQGVVRGGAVAVRRQTPSAVASAERGPAGSPPLGRGRAGRRRVGRRRRAQGHPGMDLVRAQPGPALARPVGGAVRGGCRRHPCRAERRRGRRGSPGSRRRRRPTPPVRRAGGDRQGPEPAGRRRRPHHVAVPGPVGRRPGGGAPARRRGLVTVELRARRPGRGGAPRCPRGRPAVPSWMPGSARDRARGRRHHRPGAPRPPRRPDPRPPTPDPKPRHLRRRRHRRPGGARRGPRAGPCRLGRPHARHPPSRGAHCPSRRHATSAPRRRSPPAPSTSSSSTSTASRTPPWSRRYGEILTDAPDGGGPRVACGDVAYEPPPSTAGASAGAGSRPRHHPARPPCHPTASAWWTTCPCSGRCPSPSRRGTSPSSGASTRTTSGTAREDTDFGQRLARSGGQLLFVGGAGAVHQYHPSPSPPVQHVADIVANANVFADKWGWWPMQTWLEQFRDRGLARRGPDGRWETNDVATEGSMVRGDPPRPRVGSSLMPTLRRNP